ncbi:DUF3040 domain-containing protein [Geodermatophilus sp. SYSU D01186]
MDDDPVLRALGDDLAREDPRLAALLGSGPDSPAEDRRHRPRGAGFLLLLLCAIAVGVTAPLLFGLPAIGVLGIALVLGSPLLVARWLAGPPSDGPT